MRTLETNLVQQKSFQKNIAKIRSIRHGTCEQNVIIKNPISNPNPIYFFFKKTAKFKLFKSAFLHYIQGPESTTSCQQNVLEHMNTENAVQFILKQLKEFLKL